MKFSTKNIIRIILLCYIALYNIILFWSTSDIIKMPVFWSAYIYTMLIPSLILVLSFVKLPFLNKDEQVFILPMYRLTGTYLAIQLTLGIILMVLQYVVSLVFAVLSQLILLIVFAILLFKIILAETYVSQNYEKQKQNVFSLKQMQMKVKLLSESIEYPAVKEKLALIAEKIKYSDFTMYPELNDVHRSINECICDLQIETDESTLMRTATRLELYVNERIESCKMLKKMKG